MRTIIFDSGDPNNRQRFSESAIFSSSSSEQNSDFLPFEDDLKSGSSSSSSDESDTGDVKETGGESDDDNELRQVNTNNSQRLVRVFSRVVMGGGNKRRTSSGGSKRRSSKQKQIIPLQTFRSNTSQVVQGSSSGADNKGAGVEFSKERNLSNNNNGIYHNNGMQPGGGSVKISLPTKADASESEDTKKKGTSLFNGGLKKLLTTNVPTSSSPPAPSVPAEAPIKRSKRRYSGSMGSASAAQRRAGWEPGVDIRTTDIILQSVGSVVTIVDYSVTRYRIVQVEVHPMAGVNSEDRDYDPATLNRDFLHQIDSRPAWSQVRWISVNGLSWEAISAISKRYQLHRLAIEDMVDIPQRSKVDLYPTHTFCCFPLHKLVSYRPELLNQQKEDEKYTTWDWIMRRERPSTKRQRQRQRREKKRAIAAASVLPNQNSVAPAVVNNKKIVVEDSSSSSSSGSDDSESDDDEANKPISLKLQEKPMQSIHDWNNPYSVLQQRSLYIENKRPLSAYKRAIGVEQVSLFLTSQNTVISFFEQCGTDIERPLIARLARPSTILRESCDASLLLQAIIDASVDLIQPIISVYKRRMDELEIESMMNPSVSLTQDLHLMAGELSMLRNTMVPITSLVLALRDHASKAAKEVEQLALADHSHSSSAFVSHNHGTGPGINGNSSIGGSKVTALAKVYLADISDHLLSHTQDLDVMRTNTKNMIDLIFNTIFIQSSDSISQLAVVTVVFMPLSFWTGYYGMNFTLFSDLDHTVRYYWTIAVPFSIAVIILSMLDTIRGFVHRFKNYIRVQVEKREKRRRKLEKCKLRRAPKRKSLASLKTA
jgi:Mg2+ and Co2+ transporter CorA